MDYGKRFKFYRNRAKLTQKEAADIIGIKGYQLGNYETNRSEPSIEILKKMSKAYHVGIDRMLGNTWHTPDPELQKYMPEEPAPDMDELMKSLNDLVEKMNEANKK